MQIVHNTLHDEVLTPLVDSCEAAMKRAEGTLKEDARARSKRKRQLVRQITRQITRRVQLTRQISRRVRSNTSLRNTLSRNSLGIAPDDNINRNTLCVAPGGMVQNRRSVFKKPTAAHTVKCRVADGIVSSIAATPAPASSTTGVQSPSSRSATDTSAPHAPPPYDSTNTMLPEMADSLEEAPTTRSEHAPATEPNQPTRGVKYDDEARGGLQKDEIRDKKRDEAAEISIHTLA
eukprot:2339281-Prymnesium_polylepis.1